MKINDEVTFVKGNNKGRKGIIVGFQEGEYITVKVIDGSTKKMVTTSTDSVVITGVVNPESEKAKEESKYKPSGKKKVKLSGVSGSELYARIRKLNISKKKAFELAGVPSGSMGYISNSPNLPLDTYKKFDDALSRFVTVQKASLNTETPILNTEIEEKEQKEEVKMEEIILKEKVEEETKENVQSDASHCEVQEEVEGDARYSAVKEDEALKRIFDKTRLNVILSNMEALEIHKQLKCSLGLIKWIELMRISIEEFNKIAEIFNGEE